MDDDWDDLDDYDIEQCMLKENEILSQNPELLQKNLSQHTNVSKENKNNWINEQFNSFTNNELNSSKNDNTKVKGNPLNSKKNNFPDSFSKPFVPAPKKQSFYKPLNVGPSTSFNGNDSFQKKNESTINLISLQKELEQIQKEKAKLEEENLIKQGEVYNLRCELKRKESSLETERVDHCIALEAAEKRGKDKATKSITDLEQKVKTLERQIDRLEGNILFKNREVDDLLAKCKKSENQPSTSLHNGLKITHLSPSPKKRKLEDRFSPTKASLNFADKFDFGNKKKVVKCIETQTESEVKKLTRPTIKILSVKGRITSSRKAFYLLKNSKIEDGSTSGMVDTATGSEILGQMICSDDYQTNSSEHLLLKQACKNLENMLKTSQNEQTDTRRKANKNEENEFLSSSLPMIKILNVAKASDEIAAQNALRILTLCLDSYLDDSAKNNSAILSSLESLSVLARQCSDIPQELCNMMIETMKKFCDSTTSVDVVPKLIFSLNSLNEFENFRRKNCVNIDGQCLLKKFCTLLKNTKNSEKLEEICNNLAVFVSRLLHDEPNTIITNNQCNCPSRLFAELVNYLHSSFKLAVKDLQWQRVLNGLKALHTWQNRDRSWLEKSSQSKSYSLLLGIIIRKAKFLKSKGILDQHTWELVCDIYEIGESS